jgi:Flp pilus assembly protein TadG
MRPFKPSSSRSGQALAEFALVGGLFFVLVIAIIQFGLLMWSANTVTQIARDTARWEVTQSTTPCDSTAGRNALGAQADQFARQWKLLGYRPGTWTTAGTVASLTGPGVAADWPIPSVAPGGPPLFASDCPPSNSSVAWSVRVKINHSVPIFLPGLQLFAPSCGTSGYCLTTTTEVRMEPKSP